MQRTGAQFVWNDQRLFLKETRCQRELVGMWQLSQIAAIFHQSVTRAQLFWSKVNTEPTFCTWPSLRVRWCALASFLTPKLVHRDFVTTKQKNCDKPTWQKYQNIAITAWHYHANLAKVLRHLITIVEQYCSEGNALTCYNTQANMLWYCDIVTKYIVSCSAQWYRCQLGCSSSQNLPGSNYRRIICSCSYYMEHPKILF